MMKFASIIVAWIGAWAILPIHGQEECCSSDFVSCKSSSSWCSQSASNCEGACESFWVVPQDPVTCTKRWSWCDSSTSCCDGMSCVQYPTYTGCGVVGVDADASQVVLEECCTNDFATCIESDWCNESEENCASCGTTSWQKVDPDAICTPRWKWCQSSDDCCADMICLEYETYQGCGIDGTDGAFPSCCTWNYKECTDDGWCAESSDNCDSCGGDWSSLGQNDASCKARWDYCESHDECCHELECVFFSEWNYSGCGIPGQDGTMMSFTDPPTKLLTPVPTRSPTKPPTMYPTKSPTVSPSSPPDASPTLSPISSPTVSPIASPTSSPIVEATSSPSFSPMESPPTSAVLPSGPFIPPGYSERVVIPQPPSPPTGYDTQSDCPHDEAGLVEWNLTPNTARSNIVLPSNTRVVLRSTVATPLGTVTIPLSSELILAPSDASGLELTLAGMIVQGTLTAGSETCRLNNPVTLTFTGSRPLDAVTNPPPRSVKGIDVDGGTLSLHGERFYRTWTRLSKTAEVGEDILMLQDAVNWQVGQEIVLVTTAMKDSREWHQNEVLTIQAIYATSETGAAIRISPSIQYRHIATGNYQAEVGLLTRTIKIQGSESDSEPTDPDPLNCFDDSQTYMRWNDPSQPCMDKELTGYGAHVIVHSGGLGFVEGVEFFRVGQTNVLGRYPMHFHLLGDCPTCYLKDSSIHRSYYRCVSIHASHLTTVSENVAFDVTGFCYYLEDGVENGNDLLFNMAAHIHMIGPDIPAGGGQTTNIYKESDTLTLPADTTASGFYITNIENNIIGNTASGGWSGFAFPNLPTPLGPSRNIHVSPLSAISLVLDGNTAHSTAWWWYHASGFYFGGSLYYDDSDGLLTYNPGRSFDFTNHNRRSCAQDETWCSQENKLWNRLTNSKTYLTAGVGLGSWSGRMEVLGYESHDAGLSMEALEAGFWIDNILSVCRTGEPLALPPRARATRIKGNGFFWYDTNQAHVISNAVFRNCGFRSTEYDQYDNSPNRGCGDNDATGCHSDSTVFGFLAHSDEFNPEIMQGTRNVAYENVGRRFYLDNFRGDDQPTTVSGRTQNWCDVDGTASGLNVPTLIASGYRQDCGSWWHVDDVDVVYDPQGPLEFVPQYPGRNLGHVHLEWDQALHAEVGQSVCGNGNGRPCPAIGWIRHRGLKYRSDRGLAVTANADMVGLAGGYGWYLELDTGIPTRLEISLIEIDPSTPLLFSMAYPVGEAVDVTFEAAWCSESSSYTCRETFASVGSVEAVRQSAGNAYHLSPSTGVLTVRIVMTDQGYAGSPDWQLLNWDSIGKWGNGLALDRFERAGVLLPMAKYGPKLVLSTTCASSDGVYCDAGIVDRDAVQDEIDNVCPSGYTQRSYDHCCNTTQCIFANGNVVPLSFFL
mmetsp:Transcript_17779/g.35766  ORF Transcript_17779/g.35766 Transcript_17779/m.35766 type:complete len:1390 (-) Transcript_17779:60-4229(-)